jgi:ammonium transporter Rh
MKKFIAYMRSHTRMLMRILFYISADTCGVHNLHGMPAVSSAIFSAIFAYFATKDAYGDSLYSIFPGMQNSTLVEHEHEFIIGVG